MKISVIVPVYNAASYLPGCLNSLAAQQADFEALLVDDGSTDQSPQIAGAFARQDPRFRLIQAPHQGVSQARNRGMAEAGGSHLFFLDADDLLAEGALAALGAMARDADILCAFHEEFDPDGTRRVFAPDLLPGNPRRVMARLLKGDSVYNIACNKLYRRDFARDAGLRFPAGVRIGEDALLNLRAFARAGRVELLPQVTYRYRMHPASATHAQAGDFDRHLPFFRAALKELTALSQWEALRRALAAAMALRYLRQYGLTGLLRGFQAVLQRELPLKGPGLWQSLMRSGIYPSYYALSFPVRRLLWKSWALRAAFRGRNP